MTSGDKNKLEKLKQAGFYAKGIVYVLIGALTTMAAFGLGGDIESRSGVVNFLEQLPAGKVLVALVAAGLLAYSLWRLYEAFFDGEEASNKANRYALKARYAYSGILYAIFAYSFAKPLFSNGGSSDGDSKTAMLEEILQKDWGVYAIGAIALAIAIQAVWQFYIAIKGKYMKKIDQHPDTNGEYEVVKKSGKFGYMARGVVFGILSFFLVKVIISHNAEEYKGTEGAFQYLLGLSYGPVLMGAVALGLLGFGVFCMMVARHANLTNVG